uniref:Retrovirus-related Pol polyprotein from transposon TNT 1-94 n=1 Tax=Tanacetum cinerariifolium TaxID=118510 RepID=A0A6L2JCZ9_TANCI|nr:hypothetical protein [Tanacetum cinerariifolium]
MLDEYFNPLTIIVSPVPVAVAPRAVDLADSPVSTSIDQDAPLTSAVDLTLFTRKARNDLLLGKPVDATLYRGLIRSLMYLTSSRSDLIHAVYLCAQYQAKLTEKHLNALTDYGFQFNKICQYCDNESAIALCCNNLQHSRAKHIDVRYQFIKEQMENEIVELYFVRTEYQLTGIFTKPLPRERFNFLIEKLDVPKVYMHRFGILSTSMKILIGVVIRETLVKSLSKKKKKMTVEKRKGIGLLYEVALTKEAQYEEVCKKSLRDFHKTHPSGSGTVTKIAPSAAKIKPSITNEGTGAKPVVPDVTEEESTESEAESLGRDEDDNNNNHDSRSEGQENKEEIKDDEEEEEEDEFVKTPSNDTNDEDDINIKGKTKGDKDKDEGMDYTTNRFDGDVNEVTLNQVIEDAHVTLSTVPQNTEVLVTSSSPSFDLASKFLNFLDIPHTDAKIVSPIDVHVYHEVPSSQTPTLLTVHVLVITESSPIFTTVISQSLPSFTHPPQQSTPTPPPTT